MPTSPSPLPGRRMVRAVPQSPMTGYRMPRATSTANATLTARHSKSTSDLAVVQASPYEPARIVGSTTHRGSASPPPISSREPVGRRSCTPYSPGNRNSGVWGASARATSPSSGSAPPPRHKRISGLIWPGVAPRGLSPDHHAPITPVSLDGATVQVGPVLAAPRTARVSCGPSRTQSYRDHGSPRPQTSRAPSHPQLQTQVQAMMAAPQASPQLGVPVQEGGQYEAQMAHLRNSMLQHILNVQKEITKLQQERQKAQQTVWKWPGPEAKGSLDTARLPSGSVCSPRTLKRDIPGEHSTQASVDRLRTPQTHRDPVHRHSGKMVMTTKAAATHEGICSVALAMNTAAIVIQRFWRMRSAVSRTQRHSTSAAQRGARGGVHSATAGFERRQFVAVHHAAARIQRAWKINRWRRKFVDFSEREVGWVGSLTWLQRHNRLYGTELADQKDIDRWAEHRAVAPLDREVDPWGSTKLRAHLNRMWYGASYEEPQQQEVQAQQHQQQQQRVAAAEAEPRYEEVHVVYERGQHVYTEAAPHAQGRAVLQHSASGNSRSMAGVTASMRSPQCTERSTACLRQQPRAVPAPTTASVSPRCEVLGRAKGQVLGSPPPTSHQSYQSPLRTHRATQGSVTSLTAAVPAGRCSITAYGVRSPTSPSPGSMKVPPALQQQAQPRASVTAATHRGSTSSLSIAAATAVAPRHAPGSPPVAMTSLTSRSHLGASIVTCR